MSGRPEGPMAESRDGHATPVASIAFVLERSIKPSKVTERERVGAPFLFTKYISEVVADDKATVALTLTSILNIACGQAVTCDRIRTDPCPRKRLASTSSNTLQTQECLS